MGLLRAVHLWTGRQYRRPMIRHELKRIGREIVAERRVRERVEKVKLEKLKAGTRRLGSWCSDGAKSRPSEAKRSALG